MWGAVNTFGNNAFFLIIGKIVKKEQFELLKPSESPKNNWVTDIFVVLCLRNIIGNLHFGTSRRNIWQLCFFGLTRFERWWKVENFELLKYPESPKISELWLFVLLCPRSIGTRFETLKTFDKCAFLAHNSLKEVKK